MREVAHLPGEPMNEQERRPRAFVEIVDARPIDVDETPERRHGFFDLPGGSRRENHKPANDKGEQQECDADDPSDGHHRPVSGAGLRTSAPAENANYAHFLNLRPRKFQ